MSNTTFNPTNDLHMNSTSTDASSGPPPWYQFTECAVAPYGFIFYFGVKVFNLVVGTPANVLVIWQIATKKSDGFTSDIFIFNLAVLDTYFCLMTPIEMVNRLLLGDRHIWYFQRFAYGVKDVAPLFLVCICLDRYIAVVHPVLFTGIRENKIRIAISVVTWGLILTHGLAKSILGVMSVSQVFGGVILSTFAIMVFCNISIIWVLRRSVAGKEEMHPVKRRAFKMVIIILCIIVVNYLPPVALMPFVSHYTFIEFRCQISISVFSIMDLSSSIEPLVYITKMEGIPGSCFKKRNTEKPHSIIV